MKNVKDFENNDVFFSDTSSAPTSMCCIRNVLAYSHLHGGEATQADAEQAYIQPTLEDDTHIFVVIPKDMWTPTMKREARNVDNPVWRLRRPLYGWARSGNIWQEH